MKETLGKVLAPLVSRDLITNNIPTKETENMPCKTLSVLLLQAATPFCRVTWPRQGGRARTYRLQLCWTAWVRNGPRSTANRKSVDQMYLEPFPGQIEKPDEAAGPTSGSLLLEMSR